jgi:hypothetical protein
MKTGLIITVLSSFLLISCAANVNLTKESLSALDPVNIDIGQKIESVFPEPGDSTVATDTKITITFQADCWNIRPIDDTSFVLNDQKGAAVPGKLFFEERSATFVPSVSLRDGECYFAKARNFVYSNNRLIGTKGWTFKTIKK